MTYICSCICAFTKYAVAIPIPDKSAVTVARAVLENVILRLGCPDFLLSDNGKEWENALFRELCKGLDILKSRTTMYESRTSGCVERIHRTLNSMLGKVVQTHQTTWPDHIPFVVNAYNITPHASTGYSPFFLMFGREQRVPLDVAMGNPRSDQGGVSQYAKILLDNMHRAHALVRDRLFVHGERMKRAYDRKVHEKSFSPGQRVWVLNLRAYKGRCPKWERRYQGPYLIVEKINDVNYRVQKQPGQQTTVVHVDKLRLVRDVRSSVSALYRENMNRCPRCSYVGSSRRAMLRHCLGHHGAEWQGPGRPLRPIPPEHAADAREHLRLLQRNSQQRRDERDRAGRSPGVPGQPRFRASATGDGVRPGTSRRPEPGYATAPPARRCCWVRRSVSPAAAPSSSDSSDEGDNVAGFEFPELNRPLTNGELWALGIDPGPWIADSPRRRAHLSPAARMTASANVSSAGDDSRLAHDSQDQPADVVTAPGTSRQSYRAPTPPADAAGMERPAAGLDDDRAEPGLPDSSAATGPADQPYRAHASPAFVVDAGRPGCLHFHRGGFRAASARRPGRHYRRQHGTAITGRVRRRPRAPVDPLSGLPGGEGGHSLRRQGGGRDRRTIVERDIHWDSRDDGQRWGASSL